MHWPHDGDCAPMRHLIKGTTVSLGLFVGPVMMQHQGGGCLFLVLHWPCTEPYAPFHQGEGCLLQAVHWPHGEVYSLHHQKGGCKIHE